MTPDNPLREPVRRHTLPATLAIGVMVTLGVALSIWFGVLNRGALGADYNQFYSGSRLAGTGHLYDWDALRKMEAANGVPIPTGRLPVVVYGHRILSGLPFPMARSIWLAGNIAALVLFAVFWPGAQRSLLILALAWSMSATLVLVQGQDIPFWLMFFAAGLRLLERKRPWSAGVAFAMCISKFHLALGIPILLVAQRRWRTLIAGATAFAVLIASCFLIEGRDWPLKYWRMSQLKEFSSVPERMPDIGGLASWLPWTLPAAIVCSGAVVLLLWVTFRATNHLGIAGAVAAAGGLILAPHGLVYDCVLLIPLAVATIQRPDARFWLKGLAILLISPAPILMIASRTPLPGQILIVASVVILIMACRAKPLHQAAPAD